MRRAPAATVARYRLPSRVQTCEEERAVTWLARSAERGGRVGGVRARRRARGGVRGARVAPGAAAAAPAPAAARAGPRRRRRAAEPGARAARRAVGRPPAPLLREHAARARPRLGPLRRRLARALSRCRRADDVSFSALDVETCAACRRRVSRRSSTSAASFVRRRMRSKRRRWPAEFEYTDEAERGDYSIRPFFILLVLVRRRNIGASPTTARLATLDRVNR